MTLKSTNPPTAQESAKAAGQGSGAVPWEVAFFDLEKCSYLVHYHSSQISIITTSLEQLWLSSDG